MNISNLIIQLQAKLNDATYNQLAIAKSIELLKTGRVNYVNSFAELPAVESSVGYLYYVRSEGLYYSTNGYWIPVAQTNVNLIWVWGCNNVGQLGDNTTVSKSSPVSVAGGFTDWSQISGGYLHALAVRQNGTAWAWGSGVCGTLGDNTTVSKRSPVSVVGGFTDWCQVSVFRNHSLGLRQNGTVWAWGSNGQGRLGDNTIVSKSSPVSVVGDFTDWCQISTGCAHSLGLRQNGTAWAWGDNGQGRLGDNTIVSKSSPVSVVSGFTDWCQISAGCVHSLGLRQTGTVWSWGFNGQGRLGDNTTTNRSSPVSVVGGFTDWCQVSAGNYISLGLRQTGTAWAWGCNAQGQIGDNTTESKSSPVSVVGGFTDWCQVSAGGFHSLGLRLNGSAWAWGDNGQGRLGDNTTTNRSSPVSVVGGFTDWCQVSAALRQTLAIKSTSL